MSLIHPFCWVSEVALDRLGSALQAEFNAWAVAWGLPQSSRGEMQVLRVPQAKGMPAGEQLLSGSAACTRVLRSKLVHLLSTSLGETSTVLDLTANRLAADLIDRLRKRFAANSVSSAAAVLPLGDWGVQARIAWQGCQLSLALSCSQLRSGDLLRAAARPKLAKVAAERVLSHLPVDLVAEVGQVSISVPDLINLAVDDVLVLSRGLDSAIYLSAPGSSLRQLARLGCSGTGSRAVSLLATTSANASF